MDRYSFIHDYATWRQENGIVGEPEIPAFCGSRFSLEELWNAVQSLGGSRRVSEGRLWATVGRRFHPPPTMTNFSFRIKNLFAEHLLDYEKSLDSDRAMLRPADITKNRSAKPKGIEPREIDAAFASKRHRVMGLGIESSHLQETSLDEHTSHRPTAQREQLSAVDLYRDALKNLDRATERCEYLMNLLQEAFHEAQSKAQDCQDCYERLFVIPQRLH